MKDLIKALVMAGLLGIALAIVFMPGPGKAGPFDDMGSFDLNKLGDGAKKLVDAAKPWEYPDERATGRALAAKVAANFGGIWKGTKSADAWNKYVNMIGRGLVPYCERPDIKYRFAILNTDDVNAYSCPGGYIYVTRGLLRQARTEAELAGVLAHEIAHVSQRHIEKEIRKQKAGAGVMDIGLAVAEGSGEITGQQADLISGFSDAGYEILVKKGYAKQDEYEADEVGTKNIYKMGYNPEGLRKFIKLIEKTSTDGKLKVLVSTHPGADKRADKLKDLIKKKGWDEDRPDLKERYNAMKAGNPL